MGLQVKTCWAARSHEGAYMGRIDHIVFAVRDLDARARTLWEDYGLEAQAGGEQPGAGTSNLIVPVGGD